MSSPSSSPPAGLGSGIVLVVVTVTLFWGSSFPVAKYALVELSPMALASVRFVIAAALYSAVLVAMRRRYPRIARRDWPVIIGLGLLGVTLHFWLQYTGVAMTTATNAALLIATAPIWVAILAGAMYHERITRTSWAGILVSYLGVAVIVRASGSAGAGSLSEHIVGDLVMVVDAGVWALFTVLGRGITRRYPPFQMTAWIGIVGTVGLLPLGLSAGAIQALPSLGADTWMAVLFLAGPCTIIGYGGWYLALSRVEASRIAPYQYLQPFYAVVTAAMLLGEMPGWPVALGGALILAGLYTTARGRPPTRT